MLIQGSITRHQSSALFVWWCPPELQKVCQQPVVHVNSCFWTPVTQSGLSHCNILVFSLNSTLYSARSIVWLLIFVIARESQNVFMWAKVLFQWKLSQGEESWGGAPGFAPFFWRSEEIICGMDKVLPDTTNTPSHLNQPEFWSQDIPTPSSSVRHQCVWWGDHTKSYVWRHIIWEIWVMV